MSKFQQLKDKKIEVSLTLGELVERVAVATEVLMSTKPSNLGKLLNASAAFLKKENQHVLFRDLEREVAREANEFETTKAEASTGNSIYSQMIICQTLIVAGAICLSGGTRKIHEILSTESNINVSYRARCEIAAFTITMNDCISKAKSRVDGSDTVRYPHDTMPTLRGMLTDFIQATPLSTFESAMSKPKSERYRLLASEFADYCGYTSR